MDTRLVEDLNEIESDARSRGGSYRQRRPNASRRRRAESKKSDTPGSIRQRRNKHWNW